MLGAQEKVENERLYKAFDFMAAKNLEAAETELNAGLDEALSRKDNVLSALFYSSLGVLFKIRKDFQKAWKYYEKAEKLLPEDPALKLISARLLIDVFGQYDTAIRRCKKVLEISRSDPPFLHQANATMGLAYLKSGQRQQAIEALVAGMDSDFEGLMSASNIDMKLPEALLRKKAGVAECFIYLQKALQFAKQTGEDKFVDLYSRLLESFPHEEAPVRDDTIVR
jgi:tetratricopeptide (TPR) repeat protein